VNRVEILTDANGVKYASFECPGCGLNHGPVVSRPPGSVGPTWGWNGDLERPTFTPSLRVQWDRPKGPAACHSFIREGRIEFLSDCTHALAGQTVDLLDIEA
jgi:hypothetical protein